jgi:hypothetical protein
MNKQSPIKGKWTPDQQRTANALRSVRGTWHGFRRSSFETPFIYLAPFATASHGSACSGASGSSG